jgi:hypothetical protein
MKCQKQAKPQRSLGQLSQKEKPNQVAGTVDLVEDREKALKIMETRMMHKNYRAKARKNCPWKNAYLSAYTRCNVKSFVSFKYYGGRGIRLLMSRDDFKTIWFRDEAYNMQRPSIDRIDSNGHYEIGNCRYVELSDNVKRVWENKTRCVHGHLYDIKNTMYTREGWRVCRECKRLRRLVAKGGE